MDKLTFLLLPNCYKNQHAKFEIYRTLKPSLDLYYKRTNRFQIWKCLVAPVREDTYPGTYPYGTLFTHSLPNLKIKQ